MPTRAESATAIVDSWQLRNRRLAASAYLYHVGLVAFTGLEHWDRGRRARLIYTGLLARDLAAASLIARSKRSPDGLTQSLAGLTAGLDVLAAIGLAGAVDTDAVVHDRAFSQFGLSSGWCLLLGRRDSKPLSPWSVAMPLALQGVFATLWKMPRSQAVEYVAKEFLWSLTALACVGRLSKQVQTAVDTGAAAAAESSKSRRALAGAQAREAIFQSTHDEVLRSLRAFQGWAELLESEAGVRLARLAIAERERLRCLPCAQVATVPCLAERLIAARPPSAGTSVWVTRTDPNDEDPYTVPEDASRIRTLLDVAERAVGEVRITTVCAGDRLSIAIEAADFARPQVGQSPTLPRGFDLIVTDGEKRIEGWLRLQPGRRT